MHSVFYIMIKVYSYGLSFQVLGVCCCMHSGSTLLKHLCLPGQLPYPVLFDTWFTPYMMVVSVKFIWSDKTNWSTKTHFSLR